MKKLSRISAAVVLAFAMLSTAGFAQQVQTDYDHSVDFSRYHTYSWGHIHSSDPLFEPRIREAVDRALQAKGWQEVPDGGDVMVMAVGLRRHQTEYTTFYNGLGPGWRWHWWGTDWATTDVEKVPVGTLIVDLYDTSSEHLLWRGVARILSPKNRKRTLRNCKKPRRRCFRNSRHVRVDVGQAGQKSPKMLRAIELTPETGLVPNKSGRIT